MQPDPGWGPYPGAASGWNPSQTYLRPLRSGEIIDAAVKLYRGNFRALLGATAVAIVPVQILSFFVTVSALPSTGSLTKTSNGGVTQTVDWSHMRLFIAATAVTAILGLVAGALATGACTKAVSDAYLGGGTADAGASLRFALDHLGSLLWVSILTTLGTVAGLVLCVIPGVWWAISWTVATPALLVEDLRGRHALARSFRLVSGRWWPTFGMRALAQIFAGAVTAVFAFVLVPFAGNSTSAGVTVARSIGTTIALIITTPFLAAAIVVVYYDLRVRKEGFDVALIAQRLGFAPPDQAQGPPPGAAAWFPPGTQAAPPFAPPPLPTSVPPPAPPHPGATGPPDRPRE